MAQNRASRGGRVRRAPAKPAQPKKKQPKQIAPTPARLPAFRLGAVPGATPGKWIRQWRLQRPHQRIELIEIAFDAQVEALTQGLVDAAICRRPLAEDGLHVIALYEETPVVVMSADSSLAAADELTPQDLDGEVLITPRDDVLGELGLPTEAPTFAAIDTTEDAIATAAAGAGIVVVPMSLARLHHRKDATYRPLVGAATSDVVLAWLLDRDAEDVQSFVGVTRGRTARSSR
ncbi:MAG: LysR substrate-binding domain-containing protein [Microbacterium gubbeenense]|uniref:LysR substrate-binding domain-containing protein n=1 Tax=Microbacterium gubbeenense TaxID=159896 RepID=UPI003F948054